MNYFRRMGAQAAVCVCLFLLACCMNKLGVALPGGEAADAFRSMLDTDHTEQVSQAVFHFQPVFGEPIDELRTGDYASIYAVGGGTVTETGEDAERGRFVVLDHGGTAVSVYGQLDGVFVKKLERVRKGQVIGTYNNANEKEFLYSIAYAR